MVTRVLTPEEIARAGFGFDPTLAAAQAPKGAPTSVTDLGYDPEFDAVQRRLQTALQQQQSQVGEDVNNVNLDVGTRQHALQQQHPTDLKSLLENFAGRGMAYSGRYSQDNQGLEDQYAGQLSGLDNEKANRLSAISRAMLKFQQDQQGTMDDAFGAYTQRQAAKAEAEAARQLAANQAQNAANLNPNINTIPGATAAPDTTLGYLPGGGTGQVPNIGPGIDPVTGAGGGAVDPMTGQYYQDPQQQADALGFGNGPRNMANPGPAGSNPAILPLATPFTGAASAQPNFAAPTAAPATTAKTSTQTGQVMNDPGTRTMASFDAHSQNILHGGGTVVAGNGYVYKSVNGVPVRVA